MLGGVRHEACCGSMVIGIEIGTDTLELELFASCLVLENRAPLMVTI